MSDTRRGFLKKLGLGGVVAAIGSKVVLEEDANKLVITSSSDESLFEHHVASNENGAIGYPAKTVFHASNEVDPKAFVQTITVAQRDALAVNDGDIVFVSGEYQVWSDSKKEWISI